MSRGRRLRLRYVDELGLEHDIGAGEAAAVAFEWCRPVRAIPHYRGSKHTPGSYWSATTGQLIDYESYLECQWMMLLDVDPDTVAFCGQPFAMHATDVASRFSHVPDLFARRADGTARVIDVKNPRHLDRPDVVAQAAAARGFCAEIGWDYEMVGAPDAQLMANVSWLAGYRRPLHAGIELADQLLALASRPITLCALLAFTAHPDLARAVAFHLLWHHRLHADLTAPLRESTIVSTDPIGEPIR